MKFRYLGPLVAALGLAVLAGQAVAAKPCGKAVIEDWLKDGVIDRAWTCTCLRDARDRLIDAPPPFSSTPETLARQLALSGCEGQSVQILRDTVAAPTGSPGTDAGDGGVVRWEVAILAGAALGLAALVGLGLQRQWRQRN